MAHSPQQGFDASNQFSRGKGFGDVVIGTGTQALCDGITKLQYRARRGVFEGLRVGVRAHELHPFDIGGEHVLHGVTAATTNADYSDHRTTLVVAIY